MANIRTVIPAGSLAEKLLAWARLRAKLIEHRAGIDEENSRRLEQNPNAGSQDLLSSEEIGNAIAMANERVEYWRQQTRNHDANPDQTVGGASRGKNPEEYLDHPDLGGNASPHSKMVSNTKLVPNTHLGADDSGIGVADAVGDIAGGLVSGLIDAVFDDD